MLAGILLSLFGDSIWFKMFMGSKLTRVELTMVNFICQLDLAMVSRYLVKHYSGCVCEGVTG